VGIVRVVIATGTGPDKNFVLTGHIVDGILRIDNYCIVITAAAMVVAGAANN
jgi:hypothetical protein